MKQSAEAIRAILAQVFHAHGASRDEAAIFADVLVEAELRGRPTHGLNRVPGIVRLLQTRTPGEPRIIEERGPLVRINGNDQSGYLTAAFMADQAVRVARSEGHALVGARNTRHTGMLGYYAARVAQHDLIAVLFADCGPMVAPWGAAEPVLGTNPVAAAFPARPHPILIDMGTSATTFGAIDIARRTGCPLPEESALDTDGRFTTDPHAAATILPFGGHRGYALGLLVQLLSGVTVGAAAIPRNRTDYGVFLLAMQPELFAPRSHYDRGIRDLIRRIKSAKPMHPGLEVLLPGERAFLERNRRLKEGIDVSPAAWQQITDLARRQSPPGNAQTPDPK